jgi:hypothetical protein
VEIFLSLVGRDYNTRDPAIESHREHCYFFGDKISSTVTLGQLNNLQWSEQETWSVYMGHQGMMTLLKEISSNTVSEISTSAGSEISSNTVSEISTSAVSGGRYEHTTVA